MIWGDESEGRSDEFEAKALPPSRVRDPEDSTLLGVGAAAPTVEAVGEGAGLVETGSTAGKTAWRRRLSPRHRRAVGTFFRRDSDGD